MRIAATTWRGLQNIAVTRQRRLAVEHMQAFVCVAFHGQNAAIRGEQLLEHGHLKHAPEQIAFQCGQFAVRDTRENNDGSLDGWHRQAA